MSPRSTGGQAEEEGYGRAGESQQSQTDVAEDVNMDEGN